MDPAERPWRGLALDVGPIVGLIVLALVTADGVGTKELAAQLLVILPLLARRRWPFPVLVVVAIASIATSMSLGTPWVPVTAVALASYTVGEQAADRLTSAMEAIAVAGLIAFGFIVQDAQTVEALVIPFAVVVPSWLAGDMLRTRAVATAAREAEARRAIRETEDRLRAAAAEERRAMARELHDVVAHGVSVMLIQSGAARQVVYTSPDRAEEALLTVEATGREAMAELRRLLGILNEEGEATGLAPQPGVDQLAALVERVRDAGLPAELAIDGPRRPLPASLDVTVYRIVQEALTNALRYARRAATLVRVSYEPDQLRLEILDDGPTVSADVAEGSGRGLVGMEQRAALVGGRLEAGPRLGGGYAVRAWLPLEPDAR
jgi:signal transduction histidine kinase